METRRVIERTILLPCSGAPSVFNAGDHRSTGLQNENSYSLGPEALASPSVKVFKQCATCYGLVMKFNASYILLTLC